LFIRGECAEAQAVSEAFDALNALENAFEAAEPDR
jgi:hypothetical protein